MSRSKHTRPRRILAAARVRAPYEPRGRDDPSTHRAVLGELKRLGIRVESRTTARQAAAPLPRIVHRRPTKGRHHPADRAIIARVLRFFGDECVYGIRSIELTQTPPGPPQGKLLLGRLMVPGRIVLYDQSPPPWRLQGVLDDMDRKRLLRAGARIRDGAAGVTVSWPDDTLRDFMLFEVLMHEVGHHLIQHHKGKRRVPLARRKDHEAFADLFAYRCRLAWFGDTVDGA
jgi:hypothetical protein